MVFFFFVFYIFVFSVVQRMVDRPAYKYETDW